MNFRNDVKEYFQKKGAYIVTQEDFSRYLEVMIQSFFDYPLIQFMMDKVDKYKVEKFFDVSIKAMGENCITFADTDEINGILCVYGPNESPALIEFLKSGACSFFKTYGFKHMIKTIAYMNTMDKTMKKYRKQNDVYLYFLATIPTMQKHGIARKLINTLLEYCEEKHCGVYLETNDGNDSKYYQTCGFEEKEVLKIDDNMNLYAMYYSAK